MGPTSLVVEKGANARSEAAADFLCCTTSASVSFAVGKLSEMPQRRRCWLELALRRRCFVRVEVGVIRQVVAY